MAISNFEESIKYGIERALYQPIANGLSVFEWAKIGMNSPRWISVNDRLPEEPPWTAKWVLVWFGDGSELKTEAPVIGKYNVFDKTWTVLGLAESTQKRVKITHWMPLPSTEGLDEA